LKRNIIKITNVKDKTKTQIEENYINFKNKEFNNEQEFKCIVEQDMM
jgi:predicted secreted protein